MNQGGSLSAGKAGKPVQKPNIPAAPSAPKIRTRGGFDKPFFLTVLILLAFGSVMIFSASYVYAASNLGNSYYFIHRQLIFVGIGVAVMLGMSFVDYKVIKLFSVPLFTIATILMLLVTFSSSGAEHKGAARWLNLGFLSFQPSEIMKLAVIVLLADFISRYYRKITSDKLSDRLKYGFLPYVVLAGVVAVVFILQKHLSGCIIVLLLIACMMFLGGSDIKVIGILAASAAGAGAIIVPLFMKHSLKRFNIWLNPFSDITGDGWQPVQSLYAISSGGLWGVGFGASKQKQLYLPEPQNDYIYAILCEELGFIGAFCVICLFVFLLYRGIKIAMRAPDKFSSLLAAGITFQVGLQTALNICVVTNTIPSTGISLPFFSYGGTSLILLLAEMGIMLSISRYSLEDR